MEMEMDDRIGKMIVGRLRWEMNETGKCMEWELFKMFMEMWIS